MPKALGSKHRKGQTMLRVWLILPLLCLLQACSSAFLNRPVIEDKVGNSSQKGIGTLAITAERKVVLVNFKNNRFCAEPPQDFGQAITAMAEIVAAYKREKPEGALGTTHDANLSFKNSMETTLKEVAKQPYGIMFLRYQSSFLCQMFANAALSDDEYRDFADKTMDRAYEILGKEVDLELTRAKVELTSKQKAAKKLDPIVFSKPRIVVASGEAYIDTTMTLPAELVKGFHSISLGFRKFKSGKAYVYKPVNDGKDIVLDGNSIKFKPLVTSLNVYNSGDVLEARIKIIPIKGYEPKFYHVPNTVVFYKAGDEKIKLLADQQTLTWDEIKEDQKLTFKLPKHVKQGYKDFNKIRMLSVQVDVDEVDESFDVEVKPVEKSDTQWIVKLKLDKENQKKYEKHHKDYRITLTFKASSIERLDVPKVVGEISVSSEAKE